MERQGKISCGEVGVAMLGDKEALLAAGCNGYIEKPIDVRLVVEQIRAVIGGPA